MLSYRHGFHAGNHADVLKHIVLVALLRLLTQKDKPLLVIDTHAGAGTYSLEEGFALRNAEFRNGIDLLWARNDLPEIVADYLEQVRSVNADGVLRRYPGSPRIALEVLRPHDRLRLFELHSTEAGILADEFAEAGRRVSVTAGDGFAGAKALLPPPSRRGLMLVDPSYELASDYRAVVTAMRDGLQRFATGTYAVWYPLLQRRESMQLPNNLRRAAGADWVDLAMQVKAPAAGGLGLHGSGMFIANPPWKFSHTMRDIMPWLTRTLAQDETATFSFDARET
ncbi:MAG: 23S rRNA (adenine(2030)-N(6))-methyltransferase RlmJ [Pseudomonadota bacterium]|nr:23S rRNA (adenine(2030)-N(6))-methyltransferase RlmJ [Pseudomonadota bacterium]